MLKYFKREVFMKKFEDIQNKVIEQYNINIEQNSKCWSRTHAHVKGRRICKWKQLNSIKSTFTLFHEIGHIETTKSKMRRCESEYYATIWAINKCEELGLDIPLEIISSYQKYIYRELDRGLIRHGKNYPTREELRLKGVKERVLL